MRILLAAVDSSMESAWVKFCGDLEPVQIVRGSILDIACDAVVSPANSFGFMDGGIDALYLDRFGPQLQTQLRQAIAERHHGELLVGAAEIVETGDPRVPYMIAAPTMRVPMILRDSPNPYLAARAALLLVLHGHLASGRPVRDAVQTIAFPGLGTGVGQVSPAICAHQMRSAIEHTMLGQFTMPRSWAEASERHQLLYTDRVRNLQHDP